MLEFILSYVSVQDIMWLVVAIPLLGFAVNGTISLLSTQYKLTEPRMLVIFISQVAALFSFIGLIVLWYILYGLEGASPSVITGPLLSWKGFLNQPLEFGLKADQLSLAIVVIMSFIGLAIHLYSVGFLSKEKNVSGYFSLLNLLLALELLLILTDSFFLFFVAWQITAVVGMIFISNYFTDALGARRAHIYYVVETISSAAFLLVMFLVWKAFVKDSSLGLDIFQFNSIQAGVGLLLPYAGVICLALLISVVMRSLQFPLYVWSTESVSSPLPVFTFMYAVCSVLVSVYILIRLNFLLVLSPKVLYSAAVVGAIGCLFGALAAIVQKDVRKVLAYFVISQVGLAFIGIGVGAFAASVFHVFTHAVYMTSLFLGVGSVIYITGSSFVDQANALRRRLPVTFWATLVGALAAVGVYPLSGFFGKNSVIWEAYQRGHGLFFICAFLAAMLGAIALFRVIALLFFGRGSGREQREVRLEESSVSMLVAMVVIAFASVVVGWLGVGDAFGGENHFGKWLEPGLATQMVHVIGEKGRFSELVLAVITTLFVAHAALVTLIIYVQKKKWPANLVRRFPKIHALLERGFLLNDFYRVALVLPLGVVSEWVLWKGLDRLIIDGVIVGSVARGVKLKSDVINRFRAVSLQSYLFWLIICLVILVVWSIF